MRIIEKIVGETVKGKGVGKTLGFPTLNVPYKGVLEGVFVGRVFCEGRWYKAAVNIGSRPTFEDGNEKAKYVLQNKICEAFLLDVDEDFDWRGELVVEVVEKIRDIRKFSNKEDLKKQIAKDVDFVKMSS